MDGFWRVLRRCLSIGGVYFASVMLGLCLMVFAFRLGVLQGIDILFYRGLVIIAGVFCLLFAAVSAFLGRVRWHGLSRRDAFAVAVLSLSTNLSFLVVVPVTVDRSISIFVLGEMAQHPAEEFTPEQMSQLFTEVYVGNYHQIARRLHEQQISGNVERTGKGYRISQRGQTVIQVAKVIAFLFDSHAGLAEPNSK